MKTQDPSSPHGHPTTVSACDTQYKKPRSPQEILDFALEAAFVGGGMSSCISNCLAMLKKIDMELTTEGQVLLRQKLIEAKRGTRIDLDRSKRTSTDDLHQHLRRVVPKEDHGTPTGARQLAG